MTTKFAKLRDARILLLGGTLGIGFAVAEASLEGGATVVLAGSNQDRLSSAISRLEKAYPDAASNKRILGHVCDISNADTIEVNLKALLEYASDGKTHKIDHIVFTAGDAPKLPSLKDYQPEAARSSSEFIRHQGGIIVGKLAPEYMSPGPRSSITLSGATATTKPLKGRGHHAGLASYLDGLARGLALDLAPIRVNLVALGAVNTELLFKTFTGSPEEFDQAREYFTGLTLLGKIGAPEDVAEAYLYFMKDSFVTGQTISTDGGRFLK